MDPSDPRPLVITDDPGLLDELIRLAAAAGVELDVRGDPRAARPLWYAAPVVVVGGDAAAATADANLERRDLVVLVSVDLDDAAVWERAVRIGARHVVFLPDAEAWLVDLLADVAEGRPEPAPVVGVVGGRGGAGATTLAVALGVTAARLGRRTTLVDADPLGGGLDLVLGGEAAPGLRWSDLASTRGRVRGGALVEALPRVRELTVLSWDRRDLLAIPQSAMDSLLPAAQRGSDLVVVDLPRRLDAASRCALERAAVVLLLVPAEVRAAAAAARVAGAVAVHCADVQVVVRGPAPGGLDAHTVAQSLALPLAGVMKPEPGIASALERGEPPAVRGRGPLATFCTRFLTALGAAAGRRAA